MVPPTSERSRSLTPPEATVVADLLGASTETEEERIRTSGLPRSTYQDAKLRLYAQAGLEERYVPSPLALGIGSLSLVLSRPFAEDLQREVDEFQASRSTVLLWSGASTVLAMTFGPLPAPGPREVHGATTVEGQGDRRVLQLDPRTPCLPVFFDFEGAFSRLCGRPGPRRYPRHLPSAGLAQSPRISGPVRDLCHLVRRPFEQAGTEGRAYPTRPASLPRSERRLLHAGLADWRVFPNLASLPGPPGVRFSHVLLIHGTLRPEGSVDGLFRGLAAECGVSPFLLATDGGQVLLGGLAAASDPGAKRPEEPPRPRQPVITELGLHLQGITIAREEVDHLRVHLSHRYDRVLPA